MLRIYMTEKEFETWQNIPNMSDFQPLSCEYSHLFLHKEHSRFETWAYDSRTGIKYKNYEMRITNCASVIVKLEILEEKINKIMDKLKIKED